MVLTRSHGMRRLQLADEPELLKPLRERLAITKRRRKHRAAGKRLRAAMEKAAELKEALALVKDAEENKGFVSGADNPLAEGGVGGAGTGAGAGAGAGDGDGDGGTNDAGNVGDNPQASGAEATAAGPKSLKLKSAPSKGITLRLDAKGVQEDYFGEVDTSLGYV